jgi:hypothetical protein
MEDVSAIHLIAMKRIQSLQSMLPIPSTRRRKEADKQAKQIEIHNQRLSLLHRLPPELILCIIENIQDWVDVMSFSLSCRRYALLMKPELENFVRFSVKKELKERLDRDWYAKLAEAESFKVGNLKNLLCSRCRSSHPRSMFRDSEILRSPHVRLCNGAKHIFRACPHLTLTFDGLKARLPPTGRAICPVWPLRCSNDPRIVLCERLGLGPWVISHLFVVTIPASEGISRAQLQQCMADAAEPTCPHMRTDCHQFQRRLKTASRHTVYPTERLKRNIFRLLTRHYHFAHPFQTAKMGINCLVKGCNTRVEIMREGDALTAKLWRNVGDLKMASDPKWCAQLEDWSDTAIEENQQVVQRMLDRPPPIFARHARHSDSQDA